MHNIMKKDKAFASKDVVHVTLLLTCRFGPGEDERSSAAAPHLLVAGMDVNAVDGEGSQVGDVHSFCGALILGERVFLDGRNSICAVITRAEGGVPPTDTVGVVRHAEHVSTSTVWRSGRKKEQNKTWDEVVLNETSTGMMVKDKKYVLEILL